MKKAVTLDDLIRSPQKLPFKTAGLQRGAAPCEEQEPSNSPAFRTRIGDICTVAQMAGLADLPLKVSQTEWL